MMNTNGLHNRFKRTVYKYDLISGKVNHVAYQPQYIKGTYLYRPADAMYHKYEYDAENRITAVYTSIDSVIWEKDAHYDYYKHGPLARTELGEQLVQGVDYAYTIQGWLKGVNSSSLTASKDIGEDGLTTNTGRRYVARDAMGYSLNYFKEDYTSITSTAGNNTMPSHAADAGITGGLSSAAYRPLYNGNISSMVVNIDKLTIPDSSGSGTTSGAMLYNYQYDQLNRLVSMDAYKGLTAANNSWANIKALPHYGERVTYDGNGNILTYKRNGNKTSQQLMDDLTYAYNKDGSGKLTNNKLRHVTDAITNTSAYDESDAASGVSDIENQATDNYGYDEIGNLTKDTKENITTINWSVYGKITDINFSFIANKVKRIAFSYDASGNRIGKQVEKYGTTSGATTTSTYTWYSRDASGNVMAVYNGTGSGTTLPTALNVGERHLYGSSRLGVLSLTADSKTLPQSPYTSTYSASFIRGNKYYELSNHLGNVLSTVSDRKIGVDDGTYDTTGTKLNSTADGKIDYYTADVVTANDYYPFGMLIPGRKYTSGNGYRYGFNGQEKDNENTGEGNSYSAQYWQYDARIGRRWNLDPKPLAGVSKYSTLGGNPIWFNDPNGDTTFVFNEYGKYLRTINDNLPNESHFIRSMPYLLVVKKGETYANAQAKQIRAESLAYIGANTANDAKNLEMKANKDKHELFFLGKIDATKEVRLKEVELPADAYKGGNEISIGKYIDDAVSDKQQQSSFLFGHTHQLSLEENNIIDVKIPTLPGKHPYFSQDNMSGDYGPILNRSVAKYGYIPGTYYQGAYNVSEKSKTAAIIVSHTGITVYGTGTKVNVPVESGQYTSVDNITEPNQQSFIPFKSLKR